MELSDSDYPYFLDFKTKAENYLFKMIESLYNEMKTFAKAEIISPAGAEFTVESALQKAPEKLNTGNSRLMLRLSNQSGQIKVVIKLTPKG